MILQASLRDSQSLPMIEYDNLMIRIGRIGSSIVLGSEPLQMLDMMIRLPTDASCGCHDITSAQSQAPNTANQQDKTLVSLDDYDITYRFIYTITKPLDPQSPLGYHDRFPSLVQRPPMDCRIVVCRISSCPGGLVEAVLPVRIVTNSV